MASNVWSGRARALCIAFLFLLTSASQATSIPSVQIFGTPPAKALVGAAYLFRATAVVHGPGTWKFTIQNVPRWAKFDQNTGQLEGRPSAADVGTYANVRILAIYGLERAALPAFSITVRGAGASGAVSLSWEAPTENVDGSALTDLAGYRIYSGVAADQLELRADLRTVGLTRYVIEPLESGPHFFAMSAVTSAGAESALSPIVSTVVP